MFRSPTRARFALLAAGLALAPAAARAENRIKQPGLHPAYTVELEPHFLVQPVAPPGAGSPPGFGPGFRVAIELLDNGPIQTINNTFALGFGLDWVRFSRGGHCLDDACDRTEVDHYYFPVVLQWNFWLTDKWSVFGEPGFAYRFSPQTDDGLDTFVIGGGARFHFSDRFTLTLRAAHPALSVGVSVLL